MSEHVLERFPCGCYAYSAPVGGMIEFGVHRCEAHDAADMLPREAIAFFDLWEISR